LALVSLGEEDVIPGVTRGTSAAAGAPREAPAGADGEGEGGGGGEQAAGGVDMERLRRILAGLRAPPADLPPPSPAEEEGGTDDAAAVRELLSAGTRL
jgi:hypothetical protein